jgi:hypothetical protein
VTTQTQDAREPASAYPAPATPAPLPGPAPAVRTVAAKPRSNRKLMIVGVLIALLGGLGALTAGQMITKRTQVLAVAKPVPVGATISADDLTTASVTKDSHLNPIPASAKSQIIGLIAQVALSPGELLTRAQVGRSSGFVPGQVLVALALKPGQFPQRGLQPGQKVLVVTTPNAGGGAPSSGAQPVAETQPIPATIADLGSFDQTAQQTVVDVRVDQADGVAVAQLAATGNVALLLLPTGR